jgi:hypothetical protein
MSQARKAWIRANGEIVNGEWKERFGETTRAILSTFHASPHRGQLEARHTGFRIKRSGMRRTRTHSVASKVFLELAKD